MSMDDERPLFELLPNEWNKVKCKGHHRKSWLAQVKFLKKKFRLQEQVLDIKLIKKPLIKESACEEFEMALQQKSKERVYLKSRKKMIDALATTL